MRKIRWRQFDWGLLVVVAIGLVAIWPFLSRPDLPQQTDAELHIFRLAELSRLIRDGAVYPRWAPNFYFGYGYPIFNYYAPLSYYAGMLVELLPRLDAVAAVKAVFIAGLLLGGLGVYGYTRPRWGRPAGYVAAALFLYAPYVQYVDPHARGALAESFSFGIFPLALWAADAFLRQRRATHWVLAALTTAAIILSHNLMAMVFFALLLAWWVWQFLAAPDRTAVRRPLLFLGLALLLGVGLASFFWLPVGLERDAVTLNTLVGEGAGDNFDFRNHFLSLPTLLGPGVRLDWGATEPDFAFNLGPAQWFLGLLGALLLIRGRARRPRQMIFFLLVTLALLVMMLPVSRPIWETIPVLPYLQFPWRLLGPVTVFLAILGGGALASILRLPALRRRPAWSRLLPAASVGVIILLGLPLSQVPPWPEDFGATTPQGALEVELEGRWLGTTSTSDFLPATVDITPSAESSMVAAYRERRFVDRVNRASLPPGTEVASAQPGPLHFRYDVESERPFTLRLFLFAFPGWVVEVDGQRVETELARPEGFLTVPLPAGSHTVDVFFTDTIVRRVAWALTLLSSALVMAGANVWLERGESGRLGVPPKWTAADGLVAGTAVALALLLALLLEPAGVLHYQSSGRIAIPAGEDVWADFGGQIGLIGYDLEDEDRTPGEDIGLQLYWLAQQPLDINYQVFVHLLAADGTLVAQSDKLNPGDFPTRRWPLDKYVRDEHDLTIPPSTPSGEYRISVGLWVQSEGWRLPLWDESSAAVDDRYVVESIRVGE